MLRILRRRWWLILLPVVIATLIGSGRLPSFVDAKPAPGPAADPASLASRLDDANRRVRAHEKTLDEHARRRSGQPVSELPRYLRALASAQQQLESVETSITRAETERTTVAEQTRAPERQRTSDRQTKLQALDQQIRVSRAEETLVKKTIADYQANVDRVIGSDASLRKLTEDYRTSLATYSRLLAEHEAARVAGDRTKPQTQSLSGQGAGVSRVEQRRILNRPFVVMIAWIMGGLALGIGLAAFIEYRGSSFKTEADVTRLLALPVLAAVPAMASKRREQHGRRKWTTSIHICLLMASAGLAAALLVWSLQS